MKKILFLTIFIFGAMFLNAQSHRYTDTYCFVSKEAGKSVNKTMSNMQVSISKTSSTSFRFQLFQGQSRSSMFDFTYTFEKIEKGMYYYKCTNCGRGEVSYLLSKNNLGGFATGKKGSLALFIQDYLGTYEMAIDCNK